MIKQRKWILFKTFLIAKISFSFGKVLYNDQYFWSHGKSFFFTMCFVNSYDVDTNKIHHQDLTTAGSVQQSDCDVWSVNSISFDSLKKSLLPVLWKTTPQKINALSWNVTMVETSINQTQWFYFSSENHPVRPSPNVPVNFES